MNIEPRNRTINDLRTVDYVVTGTYLRLDASYGNYEFILTARADELAPSVFGLYIWAFPMFGYDDVLKEAIHRITSRDVATVGVKAGNGHGEVTVTYLGE